MPRILVAPLDWGLGHATRCVPIIRELQRQGAEPLIGSSGRAAAYLQAEFPSLETVSLPAYDVRYPTRNMYWNIALQAPGLARAIWQEHRQLQSLISAHGAQGVISDNRFGCYSQQVPCVFISHQLNLPIAAAPLRQIANSLNHWFIRQYTQCWIPGRAGEDSIAGSLARPFPEMGFRHLGLLSRLSPLELPLEYEVLALLSGPEPQRTYLEAALIEQLKALPLRALLVQGKTESLQHSQPAQNIEAISFLAGSALQRAMATAGIIICRSGYSSLMDLAAMGKKALLIPTPGQAEQEYLAHRLQQQGLCASQKQRALCLESGLKQAGDYPGFPQGAVLGEGLEEAVSLFLAMV
jgi:UDP:flavonoid glycosyltransferase YjiC (YdhE family)